MKPVLTVDGLQFKDLNANEVLDPYEDWRLPIEDRVADLVSQMTLREKVASMMHSRTRVEPGRITEDQIKYWVLEMGATLSINNYSADPAAFAEFSNKVQEICESGRLGIPFMFCSDNVDGSGGGFNTMAAAATRNLDLVRNLAASYANEMRAVGLHQTLQPQADLATEPRWNRNSGTFGEDAYLAAQMVREFVIGYQGGTTLSNDGIVVTVKHFPGSGPEMDGYDAHFVEGQYLVYPGSNFDYHLIPFKAAVDAGVASVMPYYAIPTYLTGVGAHYSEAVMDVLYERLGFRGAITSDWEYIGRPWGELDDGTPLADLGIPDRIAMAYNAGGTDMFGGMNYTDEVIELVQQGRISEDSIDKSVGRVMTLKFQLGLFDDPYVDPELAVQIVNNPETLALEDQLAHESIVLLKNDGTLPLSKNSKVFVSGFDAGAVSKYATVTNDLGAADVALVSVSFGTNQENLVVPEETVALTKAIVEAGIPVIVVVQMRTACVIQDIADVASAVLWQFVTGGVGNAAVAEVLFGEYNPCGKLPFEVPSSMEAVRNQLEDLPYDTGDPTWPFGYGMSYERPTAIIIESIQVSKNVVRPHEEFTVSVHVRNAGIYDGGAPVAVSMDGANVRSRFVGLKSREARDIEYSYRLYNPGDYVFTCGDLPPVTVTVTPKDAEYEYGNLTVTRQPWDNKITVRAQVQNVGGSQGTENVQFAVDGAVVDAKSVTLKAGELTEISFGCSFTDDGVHQVSIGNLSPALVSVGVERWVDDDWAGGVGVPDGLVYGENAFASIADAIAAALDWETVRVKPGVYQSFKVDKSLKIISTHGAESTVINGKGQYAIELAASYATVDGFTVKGGSESGIYSRTATNNTIINNVVFSGIYVSTDCVVEGNTLNGSGITIGGARNVIRYNSINNSSLGIMLRRQTPNNVISYNNFVVCTRAIQNDHTMTDATLNWFGTTDPDALKELFTGPVTYDPWLDGPYSGGNPSK